MLSFAKTSFAASSCRRSRISPNDPLVNLLVQRQRLREERDLARNTIDVLIVACALEDAPILSVDPPLIAFRNSGMISPMPRRYVSNKNESVRMFESDFMELFSHVHPV